MKYLKYEETGARKSTKAEIQGNTSTREKMVENTDTSVSCSEQEMLEKEAGWSCKFDNHSKAPSLNKLDSGYLSTYIERRDSALKGLVAGGATRDFAMWFDRVGPDVHCNQDFHTEAGTFEQDLWHNPFERSKSLDIYLGLKE